MRYHTTAAWIRSTDSFGTAQVLALASGFAADGGYHTIDELLDAAVVWAEVLRRGPGAVHQVTDPSGNPIEVHLELGVVPLVDEGDELDDPINELIYDHGPPYGSACLHVGQDGSAERVREMLAAAATAVLAGEHPPHDEFDQAWAHLRKHHPAA